MKSFAALAILFLVAVSGSLVTGHDIGRLLQIARDPRVAQGSSPQRRTVAQGLAALFTDVVLPKEGLTDSNKAAVEGGVKNLLKALLSQDRAATWQSLESLALQAAASNRTWDSALNNTADILQSVLLGANGSLPTTPPSDKDAQAIAAIVNLLNSTSAADFNNRVQAAMAPTVANATNAINSTLNAMGTAVNTAASNINTAVNTAVNSTANTLNAAMNTATNTVNTAVNNLNTAASNTVNSIASIFQKPPRILFG